MFYNEGMSDKNAYLHFFADFKENSWYVIVNVQER